MMRVRAAIVAAGLLAAGSASAETLNADAARRFVVGNQFAYNCYDGTRGAGRIYGDGSVAGTIQLGGAGPVRFVTLPPGTLRTKGQAVCASLHGLPFEPCFNVNRTDEQSFRGSVSGLGFAYCDFTRRYNRPVVARTTWRLRSSQPLSIQSPVVTAKAVE